MKTEFARLPARLLTTAAFCVFAASLQAGDTSPTGSRSSQLAPALEEIVKLSKAGVSDAVTLAYVQNSETSYSLDAQDILRLQEQGVSPQVVTAMLQQGGEARRVTEASNQALAVANASKSQPAATTAPTPTVVEAAPASTVSVTYFGSRPTSYYPSYSYYGPGLGYYYPAYYAPRYYGYCGPRVGFGVGFGYSYRGYGRCW